MTFKSITPTLELCMKFLQEISEGSGDDVNRFSVCAQGMSAILSCLEEYDNQVVAAEIFCDSFSSNLKYMADTVTMIKACKGRVPYELRGELEDEAFQLIEDMAVIMREKYLRGGCKNKKDGEKSLMQYFETRGHWHFGDQTLVTEYYYVGLPIMVINSMVSKLS